MRGKQVKLETIKRLRGGVFYRVTRGKRVEGATFEEMGRGKVGRTFKGASWRATLRGCDLDQSEGQGGATHPRNQSTHHQHHHRQQPDEDVAATDIIIIIWRRGNNNLHCQQKHQQTPPPPNLTTFKFIHTGRRSTHFTMG